MPEKYSILRVALLIVSNTRKVPVLSIVNTLEIQTRIPHSGRSCMLNSVICFILVTYLRIRPPSLPVYHVLLRTRKYPYLYRHGIFGSFFMVIPSRVPHVPFDVNTLVYSLNAFMVRSSTTCPINNTERSKSAG